MIDLITYMLFLFVMGIILYEVAVDAWRSIRTGERMSTFFNPPAYPFRSIMVVGIFLVFLQGLNKFFTALLGLMFRKNGEIVE